MSQHELAQAFLDHQVPEPAGGWVSLQTLQGSHGFVEEAITGGQGLTQEVLIEVLRSQHQNITQQHQQIGGQYADSSSDLQ